MTLVIFFALIRVPGSGVEARVTAGVIEEAFDTRRRHTA
jgi:hypothetical protein